MTGDDLRAATRAGCAVLEAGADRDWGARVPDLDWTVTETVDHLARVFLVYTNDLASGPERRRPFAIEITTRDNRELLAMVRAHAEVLACLVDGLPPTTRAYHFYGITDPSGFAAQACDELLIHADDAARALGLELVPDPDLCACILRRLFPDAPVGPDPWVALRWANGRIALPDRPRRTEWRWDNTPRDGA